MHLFPALIETILWWSLSYVFLQITTFMFVCVFVGGCVCVGCVCLAS